MTTAMATKHETTRLANSTYDVITAINKEADFLYSTVNTYIEDAERDNRSDLVETWNLIRQDKSRHLQMLREALSKEAKEDQLQ